MTGGPLLHAWGSGSGAFSWPNCGSGQWDGEKALPCRTSGAQAVRLLLPSCVLCCLIIARASLAASVRQAGFYKPGNWVLEEH